MTAADPSRLAYWLLKNLNTRGGDLKLCGIRKSVRMLFEVVRMDRLFEIFDTSEDAASSNGWQQPGKGLPIITRPMVRIRRKSNRFFAAHAC